MLPTDKHDFVLYTKANNIDEQPCAIYNIDLIICLSLKEGGMRK